MTDKDPPREEERLSQRDRDSVSIPDSPGAGFARIVRQAAPYLAATWTMIAAIALGAGGGWWLDGRLGTRPWFAVGGTLLGTTIGMYELARVSLARARVDADDAREERRDDGDGREP